MSFEVSMARPKTSVMLGTPLYGAVAGGGHWGALRGEGGEGAVFVGNPDVVLGVDARAVGYNKPPPVTVRDMVQSLGEVVRVVAKGGVAGMVAKMAATLVPGWWAMLRAAVKVSVGAVPLGGVAAVKRAVQVVEQVLRASARAESLADSTVRFAGRAAGAPVEGLASKAASRKALVMPRVLVLVAPRVVAELAKGASDQAAAAVVSSLSVVKVVAVRLVQGPMAVTS